MEDDFSFWEFPTGPAVYVGEDEIFGPIQFIDEDSPEDLPQLWSVPQQNQEIPLAIAQDSPFQQHYSSPPPYDPAIHHYSPPPSYETLAPPVNAEPPHRDIRMELFPPNGAMFDETGKHAIAPDQFFQEYDMTRKDRRIMARKFYEEVFSIEVANRLSNMLDKPNLLEYLNYMDPGPRSTHCPIVAVKIVVTKQRNNVPVGYAQIFPKFEDTVRGKVYQPVQEALLKSLVAQQIGTEEQ